MEVTETQSHFNVLPPPILNSYERSQRSDTWHALLESGSRTNPRCALSASATGFLDGTAPAVLGRFVTGLVHTEQHSAGCATNGPVAKRNGHNPGSWHPAARGQYGCWICAPSDPRRFSLGFTPDVPTDTRTGLGMDFPRQHESLRNRIGTTAVEQW
jgi:hypothetical protein